jgi:hypothetical protein
MVLFVTLVYLVALVRNLLSSVKKAGSHQEHKVADDKTAYKSDWLLKTAFFGDTAA